MSSFADISICQRSFTIEKQTIADILKCKRWITTVKCLLSLNVLLIWASGGPPAGAYPTRPPPWPPPKARQLPYYPFPSRVCRTPALAHALPHELRNPSGVQGFRSVLVRMTVLTLGARSSAAFNGAPTGITTRAPVFDCRRRIRECTC
jgi:hypothetical protein